MRAVRLTFIALFFAFGALAILAYVFYIVEDWRGARAWAAVRGPLEAQGESFDPATCVPPTNPDDQNLAMAPFFVRALRYRIDPKDGEFTFGAPDSANDLSREIADMPEGPALEGNPRPTHVGSWDLGQRRDLAKWQTYYRARSDFPRSAEPQSPAADVLLALTRYGPMLDELAREAAVRPLARFPVAWKHSPPAGMPFPHLNVLQLLTKTLSLRATAELDENHSAEALADLEICFRLQEALAAEPTLIANLVEVTCLGIMLQPIWEGLADRRWTPEQIDRLQAHLRRIDLLADFTRSIRGERNIFMCGTLDDWQSHRHVDYLFSRAYRNIGSPAFWSSVGSESFIPLAPGGWFDQNRASAVQYYQEALLDAVQPAAHRVELGMARTREDAFTRAPASVYNFCSRLSVPVLVSVLGKASRAQANLDCAVTACALEKYWLEHYAYPESLDALAPTYIPQAPIDLIDGALLRYRRTPNGRYQLYSIGGNEKDDGGTVAPNSKGTSADSNNGDWVWQYDAAQAPLKP